MYNRTTHDEYEVRGNYGYGEEVITTCDTYKEAMDDYIAYRDNDKFVHCLRIVKRRVRNE